jgi:pimeloyl-ACP methyl ester carboxylesterase
MTASQHMVQANGLRFRTMVDGPPEGEMVLLLHGFPESADSWLRQIDALAKAGCLAVAPDMRGYGMTDAPEGVEAYSMDHLVDDVAGLIKAFGRIEAHIAGHDWGAPVAWCFASRHPEQTKSLTVLSVGHPAAITAARVDDEDQKQRSRYIGLFLLESKAEHVLSDDGYKRLRAMFTIGPNPDAVPKTMIDKFVRSMSSQPGRLTAALNYYRANLSGEWQWKSISPEQIKVSAPTVLLWGDEDPALGRRQAIDTASYMAGEYRLVILEGAGHWLQFERPDDVSRAMVELVTK